jgi:pimeloyl-ACP methyl ester carboxylesterase
MREVQAFKSEEGKKAILDWYRQILNGWPLPHREREIDTSFGKTFLLEAGRQDCPAVLLFHGSCTNSAMWLADIAQLSPYYHVFAADIIGEAGGSDPNRPDFFTDAYALWIGELLDALSLEKAALIGNSLGGWMSLKFAAARPERVSKLVLIASSGVTAVKSLFILKSILYLMMGSKGSRAMNKMVYGTVSIPPEVLEAQSLILAHFNPRTGALPVFSDDELRRLTMPVLFIRGENDCTSDTKKAAERLAHLTAKAETHILSGCGHVVYNAMDLIMPFLREENP